MPHGELGRDFLRALGQAREVAEVACEALTEVGFDVTVAMDDKAACQTLAREARSFAAMVTDINLGPGVTGQLNGAIKVVYITGEGPHLGQFSVSGALTIDKPFQPRELAAQVAALVGAPA